MIEFGLAPMSYSNYSGEENFNEEGYLMLYPDVRRAVMSGTNKYKTGLMHYQAAGKFEGRVPDYSEPSYLKLNPDVEKAVREGKYKTGAEHFLKHGRAEGRKYRVSDVVEPTVETVEVEEVPVAKTASIGTVRRAMPTIGSMQLDKNSMYMLIGLAVLAVVAVGVKIYKKRKG